jgi:hypothetical protein
MLLVTGTLTFSSVINTTLLNFVSTIKTQDLKIKNLVTCLSHFSLHSKKKSTVTALPMVIDFTPIPIISQETTFGCLTTDAFAGFCLLICLTDSNELFFIVILVLSYLLVSLVPY